MISHTSGPVSIAARGYETMEPVSKDYSFHSLKVLAFAASVIGALVLCGVSLVFVFRLLQFFTMAIWFALG